MRPHAPARGMVVAVVTLLVQAMLAPGAVADDLEELTETRQKLGGDLADITAELEATSVRLDDARDDRDRLRHRLRDLQTQARDAEALLGERAVAAYLRSTHNPVALLLTSERSTIAVERSRLLDGIGRRERSLVERALAARLAYGQQRKRLDTVVAALEADEERLAELRAELDDAFRDARRREQELASRRDRQRRVSRSGQDGIYACPLAQPHQFRDTWGAPRSGGRRHRGVDMFAPMGAEVYAITHGVIVRHSNSRLGGIGLYLLGDDGNQYYYAHLKQILGGYGPGTRVEAGELIALNGATGNAGVEAPHVHVEVRPGGGPHVNPYPYARAACAG